MQTLSKHGWISAHLTCTTPWAFAYTPLQDLTIQKFLLAQFHRIAPRSTAANGFYG